MMVCDLWPEKQVNLSEICSERLLLHYAQLKRGTASELELY